MNQATTTTTAAESSRRAALKPIRMPRRQCVGSAIASVLVSCVLFGSVVLGMTSPSDDVQRLASQTHATPRA